MFFSNLMRSPNLLSLEEVDYKKNNSNNNNNKLNKNNKQSK